MLLLNALKPHGRCTQFTDKNTQLCVLECKHAHYTVYYLTTFSNRAATVERRFVGLMELGGYLATIKHNSMKWIAQ